MELENPEDLEHCESKESDSEYEGYLQENMRRDEELIKFIDEFVNSEEFHLEQMQDKQKEVSDSYTNCVCTECWENIQKVDLIKRAQKIWAAGRQFEILIKNKYAEGILEQQKKSIKIIKVLTYSYLLL